MKVDWNDLVGRPDLVSWPIDTDRGGGGLSDIVEGRLCFLQQTPTTLHLHASSPSVPNQTFSLGHQMSASDARTLHPAPLKVIVSLRNFSTKPSLSPRLISTNPCVHPHFIAKTFRSSQGHNHHWNLYCHQLNICQCYYSMTYSLPFPLLLQLNLHKVSPCNSKNHHTHIHFLRLTCLT